MEEINCFFIQPHFNVSEILSIVYISSKEDFIPQSIQLEVDSTTINLSPTQHDSLKYILSTPLNSDSTNCLITDSDQQLSEFDLCDLSFLGPEISSIELYDVFLLEFKSGIYSRKIDCLQDSVSFTIESSMCLEYYNFLSIQKSISELDAAKSSYEQIIHELEKNGFNVQAMIRLKKEYEESLRERRQTEHEFMKSKSKMESDQNREQSQRAAKEILDSLTDHIEVNKKAKCPEYFSNEYYQNIQQYRVEGLNELKEIFPFDSVKKTLCQVKFTNTDGKKDNEALNENRVFLGYATHYIREMSRLLGIPLPYTLCPLAVGSKILSRTDGGIISQIPAEKNSISMKNYTNNLVYCIQHLLAALSLPHQSDDFVELISQVASIDSTQISTLTPTS